MLSLGWWGWAHDLQRSPDGVVVDFVLESANAGGISWTPARVGIVSRKTRLFSLSERVGDGKLFQPPSLLLGMPGAAT